MAEFEKKVAQTGASIVGLDMGGADADSLEKKAREPRRECLKGLPKRLNT